MIHYADDEVKINFSDHLSERLDYNYTYLANLFSEVQELPLSILLSGIKLKR